MYRVLARAGYTSLSISLSFHLRGEIHANETNGMRLLLSLFVYTGYSCAPAGGGGVMISGPDGYKYKAVPSVEGRKERFVSVGLLVSDLPASSAYWCDLLGMSKFSKEAPASEAGGLLSETVGFGEEQVSRLVVRRIFSFLFVFEVSRRLIKISHDSFLDFSHQMLKKNQISERFCRSSRLAVVHVAAAAAAMVVRENQPYSHVRTLRCLTLPYLS